jgi:hypothetical protein
MHRCCPPCVHALHTCTHRAHKVAGKLDAGCSGGAAPASPTSTHGQQQQGTAAAEGGAAAGAGAGAGSGAGDAAAAAAASGGGDSGGAAYAAPVNTPPPKPLDAPGDEPAYSPKPASGVGRTLSSPEGPGIESVQHLKEALEDVGMVLSGAQRARAVCVCVFDCVCEASVCSRRS